MRLSMQDKNELLKAAIKAREANDLNGLVRWITRLVDAIDTLPEGKSDAPAPAYYQPVSAASLKPFAEAVARSWKEGQVAGDEMPMSPILPVRVDEALDNGIRPDYPPPGRDAR